MKKITYSILSVCLAILMLFSSFPLVYAATTGSVVGVFLEETTTTPIMDLTVRLEDMSHNLIAEAKTDSSGKFTFSNIPVGEYLVVPADGGSHFAYDDEYFEEGDYGYYAAVLSSGENTFFKGGDTRYLRRVTGNIQLTKVKEETTEVLSGAEYCFYNASTDSLIDNYVTDVNGVILVENVPYGEYYFVEKTAPSGYFINNEKINVSISVHGTTVYVTTSDTPICSAMLIKMDDVSNAPLANAVFDFTDESGKLIDTYTTDVNGKIEVTGLYPGTYYFTETSAPNNYINEEQSYKVELTIAEPNKTIYATNTHYPEVSVSKISASTGNFVPGSTLKILKDDVEVVRFDPLDSVATIYLAPGEYTLVEETAPAGYVLADPVSFTVAVGAENKAIIENEEIVVEFNKFGEDLNGAIDYQNKKYSMLPDCEFTLTSKNDNSVSYHWVSTESTQTITAIPAGDYVLTENNAPSIYEINEPLEVTINETNKVQTFNVFNNIKEYEIVVDKVNHNGKTIFADFEIVGDFGTSESFNAGEYHVTLKPGTYTITETSAPIGFASIDNIVFTLNTNGEIVSDSPDVIINENNITVVNKPIILKFNKVDSDNGVSLKDAKFKFEKVDGTYSHEFVTTGDIYTIDSALTPGEYVLTETEAPYGYALAQPKKIVVRDTSEIQSYEIANDRLYGEIVVNKTGDSVDSTSVVEKIKGFFVNVIDFITGDSPLQGAEFKLYANEDIKHPDGYSDNCYNKDDLVATAKTDIYGQISFENLPFGEYRLVETSTKEGYVLETFVKTIVIDSTSKVDVSVYNKYKTITINLYKKDIRDNPVENAVYGLYNTEAIYSAGGTLILEGNSLVDVAQTDSTGKLSLTTKVPAGVYSLKEINAPDGYLLSDEEFIIDFTSKNENYDVYAENLEFSFTDIDKPIVVNISKQDSLTGNFVSGAEMRLIDKATGQTVRTWISGSLAEEFYALPVGTYTIVEDNAPAGYAVASDLDIVVVETTDVQSFTMFDDRITGSILIEKVENGTNLPLSGVSYQLTNDYTNEIIGVYTTFSDGKVRVDGLPVAVYENGKAVSPITYSLKETKTRDGYILDTNTAQIVLSADKTSDVIRFVNDYTKLIISKRDITSGDELPGAELAIYDKTQFDANGNLVLNAVPYETWISSNESHLIERIPAGEYMLVEKSAPAGYVKAESIIFEVLPTGDIQSVVMYDDYTKVSLSKKDIVSGEELPGATISLYNESQFDADGNLAVNATPYESWTSSNTPHLINKLPIGKYMLVEDSAPLGYTKAESVIFEVLETGEVQSVSMEDDYTKVTFGKRDMHTGNYISSAELELYSSDGTLYASWTTTDNFYYIEKMPIGQYTLVEKRAPAGYVRAENVVFDLYPTSDFQDIVMLDDYTKLSISKVDFTTRDELPGAKLALYDSAQFDVNGNLLSNATPYVQWTSTNSPYYIEKIPVGTYMLVEETAPDGYVKAESIIFEVLETGEIQSVAMENDYTRVTFIKLDGDTNLALPGAELAIFEIADGVKYADIASNAEPVATWVTNDKEHCIDKLPIGRYVLVEINTPSGYVTAEPVYFEVQELVKEQIVILENYCTEVQILKVDMLSGEPLPGAKLELYYDHNNNGVVDADEPMICSWESSNEAYLITHLAPGTYLVVETEAPNGYEKITTPVKISVEETSELQSFVVNNIEVEEEFVSEPKIPNTGTATPVIASTCLLLSFLVLAITLVIKKRKIKM